MADIIEDLARDKAYIVVKRPNGAWQEITIKQLIDAIIQYEAELADCETCP